ncbi:MAG: murein biosynthesis integral membrane protein MurJ [Bryobacteraceae bacterium]
MQVRLRISRSPQPLIPSQTLQAQIASDSVPTAVDPPSATKPSNSAGASSQVALGILVSRITGLLRETVIAHFFGNSSVAGVFRAAIRIPNLLGNLFGEGVLSATFVTVYSKLRAQNENEEAENVAAAIFGVLALVCAALVLVGVLRTPLLIDFIVPGFQGVDRTLTIHLVRALFPGAGMLVMSAWCLGILNSHRRFLLSYMAPVAMNITMITAALLFGPHSSETQLAINLAWASVFGSVLQFTVQLPRVLKLLPAFRPVLDITSEGVRTVIRNFGPVSLSRGVVQISAYIDQMIASFLGPIAISTLGYCQVISMLPISLFSMSVSAAELPALSSAIGTPDQIAAVLRDRLAAGLRRIAFFVIPSAVAFLLLGDIIAGALYQTGRFHHADAVYVWSALAGSAVGLLATSLGRLYSSAFYALLDTRTPLRFALIRVLLTATLGYVFALRLPGWMGIDAIWGVAGLTASAGVAGWVEFALLRHALAERVGNIALPPDFILKLWSVAFLGAGLGYLIKELLSAVHPLFLAILVLPVYGAVYFAGTFFLGIDESRSTLLPILRRLTRRVSR